MMTKLLSKTFLAATLLSCAGATAYAAPDIRGHKAEPLSRMRKVETKHRWSSPEILGAQKRIAPYHTTKPSDSFQYLYGPDGTEWFALCDYDVETIELECGYATENLIKGYTYTIYDNKFNEIGSIHDVITFEEGETRCAQTMLDVTVTKKFFNLDNNYEVMVSLSMNTVDYTVNTRTKVYSLGKKKDGECDMPLAVIAGYPVDAINLAKDAWSEDYYITFLTEEQPDPDNYDNYIDYLTACNQVLTTYKKSGYNGEPTVVNEHKISQMKLPGDQMTSPMMLTKDVDGKFTMIYAQYEKSFFTDPTGMGGDESMVPDNRLVIDVYQLNTDNYPATVDLINSTKVEAIQAEEGSDVLYTFYGIGNLMYADDVDFKHYSADGTPCFVVSVDEYKISDDDHYNSTYCVYNSNGERIKTIAKNTYDFVMMSDIAGFEPQAMFIHAGDEMVFEFVDLYSAKTVTEVDQAYRGYLLTTSIDRVASKNGYDYAVALGNGLADEDGSTFAPVCWIDKNGGLIRLDKIPTGQNIEMAQIYITGTALSPYVFNTDPDIEYMILVKRRVNGNDQGLREELLIATVDKGAIHTFLPDSKKGDLRTIYLMEGKNPELIVAYYDNHKFTADIYNLPFTKFAGGEGTLDNPYLIATAGDLQQIKSDVNAHYKLVSDIDCAGISFNRIDNFSGSLNGDGHTISNLNLSGSGKVGMFGTCTNATFKNLNFYNCSMALEGDSEAAIITTSAMNCNIENIKIWGLNVSGDNFAGIFGSIAGRLWTTSNISLCEVSGADINLPSCAEVAGIVGEIRTGTNINACSFSGNISAASTVGGIVASTTTGDEKISNCHVDASLKAKHTVGGIVGFLNRSKVTSNYVEGTIEVTEPSKWRNKELAAGGIAGELEGDLQGTGTVPIVNNVIGITSITYPKLTITEAWPHQLATVHRVVGRSSYNAEPEYDEVDSNGNPIYKKKVKYEEGVINNIVVSDLAVIDNDFAEKTIEGTTVNRDEITTDYLTQQLDFQFGDSADAPWDSQAENAYDPSLYFEKMGNDDNAVESIAAGASVLKFANGLVTAQECEISVYDISGKLMLSGSGKVNTRSLDSGVYMATATDRNGKRTSIKFVR